MSALARRILGESVPDKNAVLPVIETTKPEKIHVCPHCSQEIYEKHTYMEGDIMGEHITRHSDCGGAIKFPPIDPASIPAWLKPYMPK